MTSNKPMLLAVVEGCARTSDYIAHTGACHSDQDRPYAQKGVPVAAKHGSQFTDDANGHGPNNEGDVWSKG